MKTGWLSIVGVITLVVGAEGRLKALIVDGQNNHAVWPKSTIMMKQYLEDTGLFDVEVDRTRFIWKSEREASFLSLAGHFPNEPTKHPETDPDFKPNFKEYDVIVPTSAGKQLTFPKRRKKRSKIIC